MKLKYLYTALLIGMISSCAKEDISSLDNSNECPLQINIDKACFSDSYASRSEAGASTTSFQENAQIGVIVTNQNGDILVDNCMFEYKDGNWSTTNQVDISVLGKLDYIVYSPYKAEANGKKTLSELKSLFPISNPQTSQEVFEQADLMYATGELTSMSINATLKHAYSMFALSPRKTFISEQNAHFDYIPCFVSDIKVQVNGQETTGFIFEGKEYRFLMDNTGDVTVKWSYKYFDKHYVGERKLGTPQASHKYLSVDKLIPEPFNYGLAEANAGDFYCVTSEGIQGYAIPYDAQWLLPYHKCVGVVFWGDKHGNDDSVYPETFSVKGYAVALNDCSGNADGKLQWVTDINNNIATDNNRSKWNGYTNQQTIVNSGKQLSGFPAFGACVNYPEKAPANSSGWYLGSFDQMAAIHVSFGAVNNSLEIAKGKKLSEGEYWTSTTMDTDVKNAAARNFTGWDAISKLKTESCLVRLILSF